MYVDRDGTPITLERWAQLIETDGYMRLAETHVGDIRVSTIWVGIDHGLEHPNAFETMTFPDQNCWRYHTEHEALAGHDRVVALLRREAVGEAFCATPLKTSEGFSCITHARRKGQ